jgi:protocatechuate 3,4-dioxygenase beta subunit
MERRDITEGMAGHPLRVGIQVVDESCLPIAGARVEIWHCDVDGDYSSYEDGATADDAGEGTTFYRGYQTANADGIVEFRTSYPGWYRGRAVHIHSMVHIDDATVLTTQYLFEDALNDEIMAQGVYAAYGSPDTTNAEDGVTRGTDANALIMTASPDAEIAGTRALIVVGVDPSSSR